MNMFRQAEEMGEKFERQNAKPPKARKHKKHPSYSLWPCRGPQPHYHAGLLK